jgi:hypothetical protein
MYMCIIYYLKQILTQLHLCSCVSGKLTNIVIIYNDFIQDFFINLKLHLCDMKNKNGFFLLYYVYIIFFQTILHLSFFLGTYIK